MDSKGLTCLAAVQKCRQVLYAKMVDILFIQGDSQIRILYIQHSLLL